MGIHHKLQEEYRVLQSKKIKSSLQIILLALIAVSFSACSIPHSVVFAYNTRNSDEVQTKIYEEKKEKKITLYNQEFDMPKPVEVDVRLYPSTHLKGKMGESWYEFTDIGRKIYSNTFCFLETGSRRFQTPYYALKFKYPMIVSNVVIFHTEEAYNDKGKQIHINPALYKIRDKEWMKSSYVFSRASYSEKNHITSYTDTNSTLKIDSLNFHKPKPLKQIFLAFDDIQNLKKTSSIDIKKNPIIKIEGYSVEAVVMNALRTRKDTAYNEKLVREVGFKNVRLFRTIQKNVKKLKLPKSSVARLPQDINIKYALKNHAKILKTERYLDKHGRYKSYRVSSIFNNSYKYKSNLKVKVGGEKATIKKSSSEHQTAGFIEFDEGI